VALPRGCCGILRSRLLLQEASTRIRATAAMASKTDFCGIRHKLQALSEQRILARLQVGCGRSVGDYLPLVRLEPPEWPRCEPPPCELAIMELSA